MKSIPLSATSTTLGCCGLPTTSEKKARAAPAASGEEEDEKGAPAGRLAAGQQDWGSLRKEGRPRDERLLRTRHPHAGPPVAKTPPPCMCPQQTTLDRCLAEATGAPCTGPVRRLPESSLARNMRLLNVPLEDTRSNGLVWCSRKAKEPRERRRSPPAPLLLLLCTSAAGKEAASKQAGLVDAKAPALTQQLNEVAGGATTAAMRLLPLTDRDQAEALGSSRTAPATTLVLLAALLAAPPALSSGARVERLFYQSGLTRGGGKGGIKMIGLKGRGRRRRARGAGTANDGSKEKMGKMDTVAGVRGRGTTRRELLSASGDGFRASPEPRCRRRSRGHDRSARNPASES
ncbi:hypothetical protein HPB51_013741 [Rhipicephalus microplus]|uniref:Uncharacterized protein n=1 Tax=Rhipicephalus microplus TaxID=6941 RepID=A0A9J6F3F8_RHIMP|nr:hypothetical protein HPB51_013741 [Rhipicephalus microplus]